MTRQGRIPRIVWLLLPAMAVVAGCQTTPAPGRDIRARIVAVPMDRAALERGARYGDLHGAVKAGATLADAAAGRVLLASCAMPDPRLPSGARLFTVSTILPPGHVVKPGAVLHLLRDGDPFSARQTVGGRSPPVHGSFESVGAPVVIADEAQVVPWRLNPGDPPKLQVRCRPVDGSPESMRASAFRTVSDIELRSAMAELSRLAQFSDAELAAARVAEIRCRLNMIDGGEWHTPRFMVRSLTGPALQMGDIVRVRAGVDESSDRAGPIGVLISVEEPATPQGPRPDVPCNS